MAKQPKTLKISTKPLNPGEAGSTRINLSFGESHGTIDASNADFAELVEGFHEGFSDVQVTLPPGGTRL